METLHREIAYIPVSRKKAIKHLESCLKDLNEPVNRKTIKARETFGMVYRAFGWTRVSCPATVNDKVYSMKDALSLIAAERAEEQDRVIQEHNEQKAKYIADNKVSLVGVEPIGQHPNTGHPMQGIRTNPDGSKTFEGYSEDGILYFSIDTVPQEYAEPKVSDLSPIERLTLLQKELGYSEGEVSAVALLGLLGEAGEVLAETEYSSDSGYSEYIVKTAIQCTENVDELKKSIRKGLVNADMKIIEGSEHLFIKELADTVYYANILATNIGLTLQDLAQISHDKVRAKMATPTGSSEQIKPTIVTQEEFDKQGTTVGRDILDEIGLNDKPNQSL